MLYIKIRIMELKENNKNDNIINTNTDKNQKKKISPFLQKLYNILQVS